MHEKTIIEASRLTDAALLARVEQLATSARETAVELIGHLAEVERRRLYRSAGTGSLYGYCRQVLRMSEHAAYHRMKVARAAIDHPAILGLLADGAVNLTTVRLLAPHLTAENRHSLLAEATGKSRREVQRIAARLAPRPDVPSSVRKLPAPRPAPEAAPPARTHETGAAPATSARPAPPAPAPMGSSPVVPSSSHRPVVEPLAPTRYRVQLTIGEETEGKLRRLQDLLRREIPDGDPAAIFDRALTLLLADVEKRKRAATAHPRRPRRATPGSRTVPADVRRAVSRRDGDRCAFLTKDGRRCGETAFLEFHHVRPYAQGGEATVENIALRCRAHNAYEAELVFGPRLPSRSNSVRTEWTGGIPDFARTPLL